jgi:hypothetical protein
VAVKPKAQQGRSKAQKRAQHKRAVAGGRAAAAKLRKQGPSKAQKAATRHWAAAGRASQHRAAVRRAKGLPPVAAKQKLSPGGVAICAFEALAASLYIQTGFMPGPAESLMLYWRAAHEPGEGASLPDAIAVARAYGLAGWYPDFQPAPLIAPGVVLGYTEWDGDSDAHAVTVCPGGFISWREFWPADVFRPDEAWALTWRPS